jgi:[acyl-carrier-protein] S-malonyltransferase
MGKPLVDTFPIAAQVFEQADTILGFRLSGLCFNGPDQELNDTANAQPAVFVTSIAAWQVLQQALGADQKPAAVAGHSLGEYSALTAAGALSFAAGLRLVRARGLAMKTAGEIAPGGMMAVLSRLDIKEIERICTEVTQTTGYVVEVANDNCPGQVVVAGHCQGLEAFAQTCIQRGMLPPKRLKVSVAPHTSLMQAALPEFLWALSTTPIKASTCPLIGNVSADWLKTSEAIQQELSQQLTHRVRWSESIQRLTEAEVETVIELAPGKVLTGLVGLINRTFKRGNFGDNPADLANIIALANGV